MGCKGTDVKDLIRPLNEQGFVIDLGALSFCIQLTGPFNAFLLCVDISLNLIREITVMRVWL